FPPGNSDTPRIPRDVTTSDEGACASALRFGTMSSRYCPSWLPKNRAKLEHSRNSAFFPIFHDLSTVVRAVLFGGDAPIATSYLAPFAWEEHPWNCEHSAAWGDYWADMGAPVRRCGSRLRVSCAWSCWRAGWCHPAPPCCSRTLTPAL